MSEYKFWGDYSAFSINWQFYKDDCFGPTFFNITYTSPLGEIRVHLHNSSDYPNCPLYNQPSYEEVQISNLTANSNYVFCIAPYTDKGTKVLVKPIAVYISTASQYRNKKNHPKANL